MALPKRREGESPMSSFWDDFFNLGPMRTSGSSLPAVNIKETDRDYRVEVACPGLDKKDFKIELDNDVLMISSQHEMSKEEKDESGNYTRREFSYQQFQRSFTLPENAEADKISANYDNGVLDISIPKKEQQQSKQQRKNIEIK
jgi:HSP20 family protein